MNTLWHKVWADLWLTKSRSFLAILSIAVGVFCVGALYGMIDLQLSKMDAAHRQSLPSHINLILRSDADLSVLTQIKALPGVADVDLMTPLSVRFKQTGDSDWRLGTLIIRPDFNTQKFDRTTLQAGSWPTNGQIAMENLSAEFTRLKIGDAISLETSHGNQTKAITGIVRHPFVKPPKFGGQVHFFADQTTAGLFAIPSNTFRQVLVQITPPYSSERTRQIAANIRNVLAERQVPVNVTLLQDPDKHWGRPFLAGVNRVLQIMALASLALASVLILNTISAHMTQQTEQIGVMKALGAKTWTIAQLYLIETLLMAVLAIMLAIPPSLFGAYFSSCRLLALFNIDCGGFAVSPRSIGFMILG
ncbi:MAG: ABC transporter permease, partial [Methylococcales bacterium]